MKSFLSWMIIIGFVLCFPIVSDADLIAHWPLDESGEDVVGGFDGVESGSVEFGVPGAHDDTGDASTFFDGMIDVPFAEELNPEDFTIAVWARSTGGSGSSPTLTCLGSTTTAFLAIRPP